MKKIVMYLVRKKLGLKKNEKFQFVNQKSDAVYDFTEEAIMKRWRGQTMLSGVSLNWLLDDDCEIRKLVKGEETNV